LRALAKVWKEESLVKLISCHRIFTEKSSLKRNNSSSDEGTELNQSVIDQEDPSSSLLECVIGYSVEDFLKKPSLSPILLNTLMIFLGWKEEETTFLQIGHILSLLPYDSEENDSITTIHKLLKYFEDASFNQEKKILEKEMRLERKRIRAREELEKQRKEEEEKKKADSANATANITESVDSEQADMVYSSSQENSPIRALTSPRPQQETETIETDHVSRSSSASDVSVPALVSRAESLEENLPIAQPAQPDSLHHHLLLAASVPFPDEYDADDVIEIDHDESSSGSSCSSSDDEHDHEHDHDDDLEYDNQQEHVVDNESYHEADLDNSTHGGDDLNDRDNQFSNQADEEEVMLQQALALSLADATEGENPLQTNITSVEIRPEEDSDDEQDFHFDMQPPPSYPYLSLLGKNFITTSEHASLSAEDDLAVVKDGSSFFDPSALDDFGALPSQVVMVHLLRCALHYSFGETVKEDAFLAKWRPSFAGGVGSLFFSQEQKEGSSNYFSSSEDADEANITSHLLFALVILLTKMLKEASSTLAQIPDPIRIHKTNDNSDPANLNTHAHVSSPSNDSRSAASAFTLREKGMRRKAAAAADAAAVRLERRERKRNELQQQKEICMDSLEIILKILLQSLQYFNADLNYGTTIMDALSSLQDAKSSNLVLCNLSIKVYGCLFPIVYKSNLEFELLNKLKGYQEKGSIDKEVILSPWNGDEIHRLIVENICLRLRQVDFLERIVSLSVLSTLGSIVLAQNHETNITKLYFCLGHKCFAKTLLWNTLGCDKVLSSAHLTKNAPNSISLHSSPSLQFDSVKCADSIAILPQKISAHQRASKTWGTVLSSTSYSPKTGVHKWAVKLDKCEKGHVFVGVATAQAGTRTYVGGDKYGWGVIGTQALWHHRSKVSKIHYAMNYL